MNVTRKRKVLIVLFTTLSISLAITLNVYTQRLSIGNSMEPTIHSFSLLILDKQIPEESLVGEIVAFKPDWAQERIVHRVMRDYGNYLVTMGDNNFYYDNPISREDIEGVVTSYYPFGWLILLLEISGIVFSAVGVIFALFWDKIHNPELRIKR